MGNITINVGACAGQAIHTGNSGCDAGPPHMVADSAASAAEAQAWAPHLQGGSSAGNVPSAPAAAQPLPLILHLASLASCQLTCQHHLVPDLEESADDFNPVIITLCTKSMMSVS